MAVPQRKPELVNSPELKFSFSESAEQSLRAKPDKSARTAEVRAQVNQYVRKRFGWGKTSGPEITWE